MIGSLVVLVLAVVLSAVFSGFETGTYSVNRIRLRYRLEQGWKTAAAVSALLRDPQWIINATLVGNNMANYLASAAVSQLLDGGLGRSDPLLTTLVLSPVLLVFGEIVPKDVFRRRADDLVYSLAPLVRWFSLAAWPLVRPITALTNAIGRLMGGAPRTPVLSRRALAFYFSEGAAGGALSSWQAQIARNVMALRGLSVRRVLVPCTRVLAVSEDAQVEDVARMARETGRRVFPVYRDRPDQVVGAVDVVDLFHADCDGGAVASRVREVIRLEPGASLVEALYRLEQKQETLAVVERAGRALGIVTVDDVLRRVLQ